ncbi:MAG TPA: 3-methyl-2-oxobutanoate hydroxymethyltransferase, partial [Gammaproteobacteria bacterium]|nr:3-methyl-2-oxobutanoate hydroxymethyltransferase [Gammaproteobacteria bacterium]
MNINQIQAMKGTGEKSAALVVWDAPTAHIAHECGADFLIVGDSV